MIFRLFVGLCLLVSPALAEDGWTVLNDYGFVPLQKFTGGVTREAARGGLSDTLVSKHPTGDIRKARYTTPAKHYYHGILGDSIEASRLIATDAEGRNYALVLPRRLVFEDLYPRLVDLDGDGRVEIVALLTDVRAGTAIAIFGLRDGRLTKIGQSRHVGQVNRWRNVAGFADYNGDGLPEIAEVVTPHVGGTLNFWSFTGSSLRSIGRGLDGFSNHVIGSRALELSASVDVNDDGIVDLVLPSANRRSLRFISLNGRNVVELGNAALPAAVVGEIEVGQIDDAPALRVPLDTGESVVLVQNKGL